MSSVLRFISQPKTQKFVNTHSAVNGESGPRIFTQANIDAWIVANGSKIVQYGEDMLIIPGTTSGSTFIDVLKGDNGATALSYTTTYDSRKTITDMGKKITIGDATESELLVLRLVKTPSNSQTGEDYLVGYVVEENNAEDLDNNGGPFQVRVARV
jgi:hypothetical protein